MAEENLPGLGLAIFDKGGLCGVFSPAAPIFVVQGTVVGTARQNGGHYDFNLTYESDGGGKRFNPIGAAIFGPIQDLGLRLESQKDSVEVL